ncbi:MAG: single-stranded DNA-binding protein [Bacteroidales bacterium]|nr:single-stranded DNA-binding protein [Bacteroidales bacterium]MDZ4203597.1 single-stranded DNA-binding protein [Bacteroidales bacterium]
MKNRVQLIGRLGQNPEVKEFEKGRKLVRFSLATNEEYANNAGEKVKQTTWHNLVAWGKLAEICEKYLKKGNEVAVEGKLIYRNWDDKEGAKHYMTEIHLNEMLMLDGKAS